MTINQNLLDNLKLKFIKHGYTHSMFMYYQIFPFDKIAHKHVLLSYLFKNPSPQAILFRLFFLNSNLTTYELKSVFTVDEIESLLESKVIIKKGRRSFQSSMMIFPYDKFFFASDFYSTSLYSNKQKIEYDEVNSVAQSSIDLWMSLPKKKVGSVLDIGTGCGVLSILISQYCTQCIGVDINPRAIMYAKINAKFNNITNVYFIQSDLFKSIKERAFDLILSNPPYQIPFSNKMFRDAKQIGTSILSRIVKNIPLYLKNNGSAFIITEYASSANRLLKSELQKWLNDSFRIFFILKYEYSLHHYVYAYTIHTEKNIRSYAKKALQMYQYLHKHNINKIQYGIIAIYQKRKFSFKQLNLIQWKELL